MIPNTRLTIFFIYRGAMGASPRNIGLQSKGKKMTDPSVCLNTINNLHKTSLLGTGLMKKICLRSQAGLRQGKCTVGHFLCFNNILKNTFPTSQSSCSDIKAVFDSVSQVKLWKKFKASSSNQQLLHLINSLYRIYCSKLGTVPEAIYWMLFRRGSSKEVYLFPFCFTITLMTWFAIWRTHLSTILRWPTDLSLSCFIKMVKLSSQGCR